MKDRNDDDDMRAAFEALRGSENRAAPDFHTTLERARAKARGPATARAMPAALVAGAVAAVVLLLALAGGWLGGSPADDPTVRLVEALPPFLEPAKAESGSALFATLPPAMEHTPTDFLLPNRLTIELF